MALIEHNFSRQSPIALKFSQNKLDTIRNSAQWVSFCQPNVKYPNSHTQIPGFEGQFFAWNTPFAWKKVFFNSKPIHIIYQSIRNVLLIQKKVRIMVWKLSYLEIWITFVFDLINYTSLLLSIIAVDNARFSWNFEKSNYARYTFKTNDFQSFRGSSKHNIRLSKT